jgi:hypothetical protein
VLGKAEFFVALIFPHLLAANQECSSRNQKGISTSTIILHLWIDLFP